MIYTNVKMALASIKGSKIRSALTMVGIVIGVMSVVVTVSLGEGVKNQVIKQVNQLGSDIIVVRPGKTIERDANGKITKFNIVAGFGASTITEKDIANVRKINGVDAVAPASLITAAISTPEITDYAGGLVIATTSDMGTILNQKLDYGDFFTDDSSRKLEAVIGSNVAAGVFKQRDPIGRVMTIRGQDFVVRGIFAPFPNNPLNVWQNYNDAVFIPFETGKRITEGTTEIRELSIKATDPTNLDGLVKEINKTLLASHGGQEDYTILKQSEFVDATDQVFSVLTTFVAAIAGISLLVGGIGIMNIMLVSVSERTKEIGVRKAVGATNKQILGQFLIEAIVLSAMGGLIGVILSAITAYIIKMTTDLTPSLSFKTILLATGIAAIVGVVFGMAPAIKAARKDPIQALRHE
jgi:ABC-type antimicrobial peptide transport system permease subunit